MDKAVATMVIESVLEMESVSVGGNVDVGRQRRSCRRNGTKLSVVMAVMFTEATTMMSNSTVMTEGLRWW